MCVNYMKGSYFVPVNDVLAGRNVGAQLYVGGSSPGAAISTNSMISLWLIVTNGFMGDDLYSQYHWSCDGDEDCVKVRVGDMPHVMYITNSVNPASGYESYTGIVHAVTSVIVSASVTTNGSSKLYLPPMDFSPKWDSLNKSIATYSFSSNYYNPSYTDAVWNSSVTLSRRASWAEFRMDQPVVIMKWDGEGGFKYGK
jgi:hypothetical protein